MGRRRIRITIEDPTFEDFEALTHLGREDEDEDEIDDY